MIKDRAHSLIESGDIAEGVSFDGATDYISNGYVGNHNSRNITISTFLYLPSNSKTYNSVFQTYYDNLITKQIEAFYDNSENRFFVYVYASNGVPVATLSTSAYSNFSLNTWNHIMIKGRLYSGDTIELYVNGILVSSEVLSGYAYATSNIGLTVGKTTTYYNGTMQGRVSNFFLDTSTSYTVQTFLDSNNKPITNLDSYSPDCYLPMKDASTAHQNLGTGGDFSQNGTLATADRGANQDNCVASYFKDTQNMSKGISFGTVTKFTVSFSATIFSSSDTYIVSTGYANGSTQTNRLDIRIGPNTVSVQVVDNSNNTILSYYFIRTNLEIARSVTIAIDLENTTNCVGIIDGKVENFILSTGIGGSILLNNQMDINDYAYFSDGSRSRNASIGELYFDTNYIDLSTNNPFWDSETNKPIPVRAMMRNTGAMPLIAMPIDASCPEKNYGTGGDFTLYG